jgi:outer membrane biosynthesis protein TonB
MQRKSLTTSLAFHAVIVLIATVSLPWIKRDFVIPPPITVELADVSEITQTDKFAQQPKKEDKKEEKKKPDDTPPPKAQPVAQNTSDAPVVPVKKEIPKEKPKEEKKKDPVVDELAREKEKKKQPEKKKEEKKPEPQEPKKDFSSVLKNLVQEKEAQPTPPTKQPVLDPQQKTSAPSGQNAPIGAKLTMSEEDALRHQLEGCWNVPIGARDAESLVVEIFMVIGPDRMLREARVVDTGRYNSDTFFRAAADSALRAVRNPNCSPFQVPPDKYDTWKETTVRFDPSQMF